MSLRRPVGLGGIDWTDDRGQVAGIEAIPFGILLFVVGALLIANAWAVIDAKMAVTSAAREAARTYVEAPDHRTGLVQAEAAARAAVEAHGGNVSRLSISGPTSEAAFGRCNHVSFTVSYPVPALTLPFIGGLGRGFVVRSTQTEIVDPFRNDVPGEAVCGG
jgi:Flp pilus assembly protein TadG